MRFKHIAVAGFAAAGVLAAASPAMAGTARQSAAASSGYVLTQVNPTTFIAPVSKTVKVLPLIGSYKLCTRSGSPQRCMTGEGAGEQFQLHSSGYSTFNRLNGQTSWLLETPSGLYVKAFDAANQYVVQGVTVGSGNNQAEEWYINSDGNNRIESVAYSRWLATIVDVEGAKTTTQPSSGAYYMGSFGS